MKWTAEEARYAIDRLIARRKIRLSDVESALRDRPKEIQDLRSRLAELEGLGAAGRRQGITSLKRRKAKRSKRKLSAQARSRLRLQGKYMGHVRRLTGAQKAEVRKVRKEKGWRAAIATAKKISNA